MGCSINILIASFAKSGAARSFIVRSNTLAPSIFQNECIIAECRKSIIDKINAGDVIIYKDGNKSKRGKKK